MSETNLQNAQLSPTKRALLELKTLRAKLAALERARTEPIAIVGMGCRFPGNANDPDAFWHNLKNGIHTLDEIPKDRWDVDAYYDSDPNSPGKMYTKWGGYLPDVDQFDAAFFDITPREAKGLDPQQRLLLEVSWQALERAGIKPDSLEGSQTGVYFGVMLYDYGQRYLHKQEATAVDAYYASGTDTSFAAGRVSYILGLQGPSLTLNTVCSSSLVAVHLACQSLRSGETDMALAGGANVITSPEMHISLSRLGALAPDGISKTFDAGANGYVRSEGCGIVVLKRLSDALSAGDPIVALIRGSAVNHDGPSGGLTVPNGPAQQALIRRTLKNAGVDPRQINYVEAHGTGTPLGDPIEVQALSAVMSDGRSPDRPLMIGSVKTNIGHLESAAGVAGLMKVALSLNHQAIPPHLHLQKVNEAIGLEEMPITIPTTLTAWPVNGEPRLAGVSSFGLSGINAHIILEEAPPAERPAAENEKPAHLLTLSAKSSAGLQAQAAQFANFLTAQPRISMRDVSYTGRRARVHFNHRLSVAAEDAVAAAKKLAAFNPEKPPKGVYYGQANSEARPLTFLFPGQGGQYVGMGRELYETQPEFRQTIDECAALVRPYLARPLLSIIYPQIDEPSPLHEMIYAQPAMFTIEYALAKLWLSWGIQPDFLLGHSLGEYAAACLAGVFSLADGLKLVAERGRLMQMETEPGWMVVAFAAEEQVLAALSPYREEVSIAAVNGPSNVTISGRAEAVRAVMDMLAEQGVQTRKLNIPHASHSPLMEPILAAYEQVVASVPLSPPSLKIISNVTGTIAGEEMTQTAYWVAHMRQAVRFADGINYLKRQGMDVFIEMGPKPTLLGMGQRITSSGVWLPSLRPKKGDWQQILTSAGALYTLGIDIDWAVLDAPYGGQRIALPSYPFQRQRYWLETKPGLHTVGSAQQPPSETVPNQDWLYEVVWQAQEQELETGQQEGWEPDGRWLVFADEFGLAEVLVEKLSAHDQQAVLAWAGKEYAQTAPNQYCLNPAKPEQFRQLLRENGNPAKLQGIIYLWGAETSRELSLEQLAEQQQEGYTSVLYLLQAMQAEDETIGTPRLWLVTRGAQFVDKEPTTVAVAQAPLWGFGRVIALEQPERWGGLIDLPPFEEITPTDLIADCDRLLAEISNPDKDNQVVFRKATRFVPRLVRPDHQNRPKKPLAIDPKGAYLITGGLGNLGLAVAHWLANMGAKNLVLTSRRGLPALESDNKTAGQLRQIKAVQTLTALGVTVKIARADVADWQQMSDLITDLTADVPLRGIIHAAGVVSSQKLSHMSHTDLASAFQAKVRGTWVLHQLTQGLDIPLDFFVLFSSGAALWGSQGLAHYAAANHFLDSMAHYRRSLGLPALSVNWGWWDGQGVVTDDLAHFFAQIGLKGMPAESALDCLRYLLEIDAGQQAVAAIDWQKFKPIYEIRGPQPFLAQIMVETTIDSLSAETSGNTLISQLKALPLEEKWELLLTHVCEQVADVIEVDSPESLDADQGFFAMGMDSNMTVELRNRLQSSLACVLPLTVAFEYPTIQELVSFLANDILKFEAPINSEQPTVERMEERLSTNEQNGKRWDALSEEELLSLVDNELMTIGELL